MKPAALTLVLALSLSASAFAQQEARNEREYTDVYDTFTVGLQNTIPGSKAFDDVRWSELISGGVGLDLEYSRLWRQNSWIYWGYYGSLQIDSFGGKKSTQFDSASSTFVDIRTDRLNMGGLLVGTRLRENFSGFHMDQSVGIGASMYMKEKIDVLGGASGLEFIKSSVNYAAEIAARIGAPLGKSIDLNLGVGMRFNGAPDEGKDFTGSLKFKPQQNLVLALTLDFGF